jgi:hypothetical protein
MFRKHNVIDIAARVEVVFRKLDDAAPDRIACFRSGTRNICDNPCVSAAKIPYFRQINSEPNKARKNFFATDTRR